MATIAPAAPAPKPGPTDDNAEARREELAMLEGHDADIPTEEQPTQADQKQSVHEASSVRESSPSPASTDEKEPRAEEEGRTIPLEKDVEKAEKDGPPPPDLNIVDWDGPDDPENPMNWTNGLKWGIVATISAITFIT